jgi:hypothetical protein
MVTGEVIFESRRRALVGRIIIITPDPAPHQADDLEVVRFTAVARVGGSIATKDIMTRRTLMLRWFGFDDPQFPKSSLSLTRMHMKWKKWLSIVI